MAPAVNAPAAKPNANPGPMPRACAVGAVTVVAATAPTIARTAIAFLIRISSIRYPF
jgi:hypothetical protein